jgi:dihydrofolate reductase
MRRVTVTEHLTLDGVTQAPGRPDEDTRGVLGSGELVQSLIRHQLVDEYSLMIHRA